MPEAARVGDEISHTYARTGFIVGSIAAAAVSFGGNYLVGMGLALLGPLACVFPFGTLAAIAIGLVVTVAANAFIIEPAAQFVQSAGEAIGRSFGTVTGMLDADGSPDVFINNIKAMRAWLPFDHGMCSWHSPMPPSMIVEGATTVWINGHRAARVGDGLDCDAKISSGSPDVDIGSPPFRIAENRFNEISDDDRKIAEWVIALAGLAGGLTKALSKSLPCALANVAMAVGMSAATGAAIAGIVPKVDYGRTSGEKFGNYVGNVIHGKPVHVPTGAKILPHETDVMLPGLMPIGWSRFYNSTDPRTGVMGQGWVTPSDFEIVFHKGTLSIYASQGREVQYRDLKPGERKYDPSEQLQIARSEAGDYYISYPGEAMVYHFGSRISQLEGERLRVKQQLDLHDNSIQYRYNDDGFLTQLSNNSGYSLTFVYTADQLPQARLFRIVQTHAPEVPLVQYGYDTQGNLQSVVNGLGIQARSFGYQNHMMVWHADAGGMKSHYEWDQLNAKGRVLRNWVEQGEDLRFAYGKPDPLGNYTVTMTDQLGRFQSFNCNRDYLVTCYTDALGNSSHLMWGKNNRLVRHSLHGRKEYYRLDYNERGQLCYVVDPLNRVASVEWRNNYNLPSKVTGYDEKTWQYEYDDKATLVKTIAPDASTELYVYTPQGLLSQHTDAIGGTRLYSHDQAGMLTRSTDCSGQSTFYSYNRLGDLVRITDAAGQSTQYTYDAIGQLTQLTQADGAQQRYTYEADGLLSSHTDALGHATNFRYNVLGQLRQRQDALGKVQHYHYDAALRLARLTNENERSYAFEYDALDRPVSEQRLDGSRISTTYDASGWPTSTTHHPILGDDYLFVSHPIVTASGELSSRATPPSKAIRTTYARNLLGQLLYKRTGEIRTDYTYDAAGQLLDISDWQEHHGPVLAANKNAKTDTALCTLITRCTFAYTAMGDLQAQHTFDSLTGETQTLEHTITHTYDALGNRTATTLPDGRSLNHLHYGSGHLHQINLDGHIISDFERNALHQEIGRSHGAQLDSHYRLDPLGRTLHLQTRSSSGNVLRKDYNYSATGELLASSSQRPSTQGHNSHSQQHRYDALGRIQSSVLNNNSSNINNNNNNQTEHFSYDPAGNLLDRLDTKTGLGSNNPIGSNSSNGFIQDNLLRVFEDKRYFYDGHGRLLVKKSGRHQTQYFEWDDSHQLQAVHTVREDTDKATKTVASTRFTYDPLGRRTSKTHHDSQQATTTRFAWDGLKLLSETRQTVLGATSQGETLGDKTSLYIYADTGSYEPLARVDTVALKTAQNDDAFAIKTIANLAINTSAGEEISSKSAKIFYFHNDLNGLPQELSQDGQFVWRASYKVWGNVVSEEWTGSYAKSSAKTNAKAQPETQNLRFQGQYYDVETGLHYNTFRFYDPDIGRFTSPDPIGLAGGDNLYAYAPNPIAWVDPWGLANYPSVTFPSSQVLHETTIPMQGDRNMDFGVANKQAGILGANGRATQTSHKTLGDVVWHHADYDPVTNKAKMQLVTTADHMSTFPHSGSVSKFEKANGGVSYGSKDAKSVATKLNATVGC
jgi:RHS repeat-associated protein